MVEEKARKKKKLDWSRYLTVSRGGLDAHSTYKLPYPAHSVLIDSASPFVSESDQLHFL